MPASFLFKMPLNEWHHHLKDINFWLNGYQNSSAYHDLEGKLHYSLCQWNLPLGIGPASIFMRAISNIMQEAKVKNVGPFDYIIKVDLKQAATTLGRLDIKEKLAIKVAEELGLLNRQEDDETKYYSYDREEDATRSLRNKLISLVPQINQKLIGKKYLLVVENLYEPVESVDLSMKVGLPPHRWNNSRWIMSTTSRAVYDRSKPDEDGGEYIRSYTNGDDMVVLILYSLHQAAKYILCVIGKKDEQYWHHVAIQCFHSATMLLTPHFSSDHGDGDQRSSDAPAGITSDELIRQWAAQGLITVARERTGEVTSASYHDKYSDIYQVGNVILEAFQEYSLLQVPCSPADEAIKSAAHFLAYHSLIAERHTADVLCEGNYSGSEVRMQWISHVGDQGWHVSRDWLSLDVVDAFVGIQYRRRKKDKAPSSG